jgi:APA family basic amino acid/polyamine antiporter
MQDTHSQQAPQLLRVLGLREGIAIHMGNIIGSGIFIVPATIAGHLPGLGPILIVWVVAGLLTLFGALTLAELSAVLPQAGGPYVYLRKSFGRIWAFLFSWNDFFINKAGSAAALSIGFTTFLGHFVPAVGAEHAFYRTTYVLFGQEMRFAFGWMQLVAMSVILLVTLFNVRGVRFSAWVMNIFTTAKVTALVGLILAVLFSGKGSSENLLPWWPESWNGQMMSAFGLAMISVLWAYDGWIDVSLNAGEFKNPQRNVPFSLLFGTLAIIALYICANLAYAYILPFKSMVGSQRIAADVAQTVLGPVGASLIIIGIMASMFGTTNGMLLTGPRSIYAAGVDGTIAKAFGKVHPKYHSPYVSIVTLGIWGALLTLSGTYEQITSYVVFGSWFFYAMTALSVIILRRKMPNVERPYKAWGYPYATLLFVSIAAWFIYNTLVHDTRNAMIGVVLLVISLPFYFYWTRKRVPSQP